MNDHTEELDLAEARRRFPTYTDERALRALRAWRWANSLRVVALKDEEPTPEVLADRNRSRRYKRKAWRHRS